MKSPSISRAVRALPSLLSADRQSWMQAVIALTCSASLKPTLSSRFPSSAMFDWGELEGAGN